MWTIDPSIPESVLRAALAAKRLHSGALVLGIHLDHRAVQRFLRDALGVDPDVETQDDVCDALQAHLAEPIDLPDILSALRLEPMDVDEIDLARHEGVDPLRLFLSAFAGTATVRRGARCIHVGPTWPTRAEADAGRGLTLKVGFTLGRGVSWRDRMLRIRRGVYPQSIVDVAAGRPATDFIDHPWDGWRRLHAEKAACSSDALTIRLAHAKAA